MIRRLFRRGIRIGAVVGAILFLVQIFLRNPAPKRSDSTPTSADKPTPPPPQPKLNPKSTTTPAPGAAPKTAKATAKPKAKAAGTAADNGIAPATTAKAWTDPVDGACPTDYPVKVKLASGIFHIPGGLAYDRTAPDRCYVDAAAAEKDGFRQSKR